MTGCMKKTECAECHLIKNCKKYVSHIHINDNFGDIDSHLAIGEGSMDYDYIISELNKFDDVTILIEVKTTEDFIKSYDYLVSRGLKLC